MSATGLWRAIARKIFFPLLACYLVSFMIAYTHIGNLLGTSFGTSMLLLKLVVVTVACLSAVLYFCLRLKRVCTEYGVSSLSIFTMQASLVLFSTLLLISTPGWAVALGVSYR